MIRLLLALVSVTFVLPAADPVAQIDAGPIAGRTDGSAHAFLGIPFAAPPTGSRRWMPPHPVEAWTTVRDCTAYSLRCPQPPALLDKDTSPQGEDCLYLNVWTPAVRPSEPMPVMVWIHGGGWTTGAGSQAIYRGERLAAAGVVLVTVNYRLGPFGFLAHPLLSAESGSSGNYGMLDLLAALHWTQRNAKVFGGDPGNVTIFGESAGGGCVARLLVMPAAKGLFHRAIIQSAGFSGFSRHLRESSPNTESAEQMGARIAALLVPADAAEVLVRLRAVPAADLLAAAKPAVGLFRSDGNSFAPVVDGVLIPDFPERLLERGLVADVPVLLGSNADEGTVFTANLPLRQTEDLQRICKIAFGTRAEEALRLFPVVDGDVRSAANALIGITSFVADLRRSARQLSRPGRSPVFLYHFTRVPPLLSQQRLGSFHSAEIGYVFGRPEIFTPLKGASDEDLQLSAAMLGAWVRFARTGDPNGDGLPVWPAYTTVDDTCLEFGDTIRVRQGLHREACDLADAARAEKQAAD